MSSSKSLIYIKNKIGSNTDPCSTPLKTDLQFETPINYYSVFFNKPFFYPVNHTISYVMDL